MSRSRWRDPPARAGKDAPPLEVETLRSLVQETVDRVMADRPAPRNGRDADPEQVRKAVEDALRSIAPAEAKDGEQGPRGARGEVGPMPRHRWHGTKLQFEQASGDEWGKEVDLQGPRGDAGLGGGGVVILPGTGGGGSGNNYFPGGWL